MPGSTCCPPTLADATHGVRNHQRGLRRRDARGPGGSGARRPAAAERRLGELVVDGAGWLGDRAESAIARPLAQRPLARSRRSARQMRPLGHAHRDGRAAFSALDPAFGRGGRCGPSPVAEAFSLVASARPGAACIAGPHRMAELRPLLRFAHGLRVYGRDVDRGFPPRRRARGSSTWGWPGSPSPSARRTTAASRGGSAAGAAGRPGCGRGRACCSARHSAGAPRSTLEPPRGEGPPQLPRRASAALGCLAASGRVGYDLAEQSFFRRELPFGPAMQAMHPRLASARRPWPRPER